jgi:hypothetical protein
MNIICKKCNNKIDGNSKFCTYCGANLESQKPFQIEEESNQEKPAKIIAQQEQPKLDDNLEKICSHLEFLGYNLEKIKSKDNTLNDSVIAQHSQKNSVFILRVSPNIILFKISLSTNKKHVQAMDAFINEANKILVFSKIYTELDKNTKEVILRIEALYTSDYHKAAFGEFFEALNTDVSSRLSKIPNCDKLFLD